MRGAPSNKKKKAKRNTYLPSSSSSAVPRTPTLRLHKSLGAEEWADAAGAEEGTRSRAARLRKILSKTPAGLAPAYSPSENSPSENDTSGEAKAEAAVRAAVLRPLPPPAIRSKKKKTPTKKATSKNMMRKKTDDPVETAGIELASIVSTTNSIADALERPDHPAGV